MLQEYFQYPISIKHAESASCRHLGYFGRLLYYQNPESAHQGYFSELSAVIKEAVETTVILTGLMLLKYCRVRKKQI